MYWKQLFGVVKICCYVSIRRKAVDCRKKNIYSGFAEHIKINVVFVVKNMIHRIRLQLLLWLFVALRPDGRPSEASLGGGCGGAPPPSPAAPARHLLHASTRTCAAGRPFIVWRLDRRLSAVSWMIQRGRCGGVAGL